MAIRTYTTACVSLHLQDSPLEATDSNSHHGTRMLPNKLITTMTREVLRNCVAWFGKQITNAAITHTHTHTLLQRAFATVILRPRPILKNTAPYCLKTFG